MAANSDSAMRKITPPRMFGQHGAAAVEFALIALVFFALLIGVMEFGRILFAFNSAAEATRFGARVAAVCNPYSESMIISKMQLMMPQLTTSNVSISYIPAGCDVNSCQRVQVGVTGITFTPMIPVPALNIAMPPFTATLPRESMQSTIAGDSNPECA